MQAKAVPEHSAQGALQAEHYQGVVDLSANLPAMQDVTQLDPLKKYSVGLVSQAVHVFGPPEHLVHGELQGKH